MARILIVDDERENVSALTLALKDENPDWRFEQASSEQEAFERIENCLSAGDPIDVVLTDLVMTADDGGMRLLNGARTIDPQIMAILFTAKEKNLDRYAAFDIGAFDVVEKNLRGTAAVRELNVKTRAALRYREWSQRIGLLRRYFDPAMFDSIGRDPQALSLRQRFVTLVFWDIRGFSRLCESLKAQPTLISGFLREYFSLGAKIIFERRGVLDKFMGDGIMAFFGLVDGEDGVAGAVSAVESAMELRLAFSDCRSRWTEQWKLYTAEKIDIGLGCGIHTGEALVGNVGSDIRDQFTALGPAVNLAARIGARAKSEQILMSQSTEARVRARLAVRAAGELTDIKNIPGEFKVFEI